jgi:hypothetical protein
MTKDERPGRKGRVFVIRRSSARQIYKSDSIAICSTLYAAAPRQKLIRQYDQSSHQNQMNYWANDMSNQETNHPENDQDDGNGIKNASHLCASFLSAHQRRLFTNDECVYV